MNGSDEMEGYTYVNNTHRYHGKLYVRSNGDLRQKIFQELHTSGSGGHSGIRATIQRIIQLFYWPNLSADITKAVQECLVCQRNKWEHIPYPGMLQPNPIPTKPWTDIVMDFIEDLPTSDHKNSILVVVNKFTKFTNFIPLLHPTLPKM